MIGIDGKEPLLIRIGDKAVAYVYVGANLVWGAIKSCFGLGWWVDRLPWRDDDAWKD